MTSSDDRAKVVLWADVDVAALGSVYVDAQFMVDLWQAVDQEQPRDRHTAADALAAALTYVHSRIMKEIWSRGRR